LQSLPGWIALLAVPAIMILCLNEDWVAVLLGLLSARFGLDPDFTGYENIFLRGVFLGMSRSPHLQQGGAAQARNGCACRGRGRGFARL